MTQLGRALKQTRQILVDAEIGLGFLEALGHKYKIGEREEMTLEVAELFRSELRTVLQTLGFETTAVLIQCMILTGNETLAGFVGVEPHTPSNPTVQ